MLKTIAAFQNTEGGVLYIGVADDGSPVGIQHDVKFQGKESFYARTGPSTTEMTPSEMHRYIRDRFPA